VRSELGTNVSYSLRRILGRHDGHLSYFEELEHSQISLRLGAYSSVTLLFDSSGDQGGAPDERSRHHS